MEDHNQSSVSAAATIANIANMMHSGPTPTNLATTTVEDKPVDVTEAWLTDVVGFQDNSTRTVKQLWEVLCSPQVGVHTTKDLKHIAVGRLIDKLPSPFSLVDKGLFFAKINELYPRQVAGEVAAADKPMVDKPPPEASTATPGVPPSRPKAKKRPCMEPGCSRKDAGRGFCQRHGGGKRCRSLNCAKGDAGGGFCVRHGGGRRCSMEGCNISVRGSGRCLRHGGGVCSYEGCAKGNAGSGFCIRHGGGKKCQHPGCTKSDVGGGLCRRHGGGRLCKHSGCDVKITGGKFCVGHGGGRKNCRFTDSTGSCDSKDAGGGYCIKHGGGKRCAIPRCHQLDKGGGYCYKHGGGRRCQFPQCDKSDARKGFCIRHYRLQSEPEMPSIAEEVAAATDANHQPSRIEAGQLLQNEFAANI